LKTVPFPAEPLKDAEWSAVDAAKTISGAPQQAYRILYTNGALTCGIYECTTGAWRVDYAGEDEFCTLIEGAVRLTDSAGNMQEYKTPESFLIPSGFSGVWEAVTGVRKYFVICENAP